MTETLLSEKQGLDLTNPDTFQAELDKLEAEGGDSVEDASDDTIAPIEGEDTIAEPEGNDTVAAQDDDEIIITDKGKMVPYSALKNKVDKANQAELRAAQAETKLDMLVKALEAKSQREQEAHTPKQAEVPVMENPYDINVQPVEYLAREVEIAKAETKAIKAAYDNDKKQVSQVNEVQQVFNKARSDIATAAQSGTIPDAQERADYLIDAMARNFSYFAKSPQEHQDMINNYALSLAGAAKDRGVSVAQHIKDLSETVGYRPKAKDPVKPANQTRDVDAIAKNKSKSSSLSGSSGSASLNGAPTTIKAALNKNGRGTDEEAFNRMLEQLNR